MVQQHPTEGLAVVFQTPHNSVAVPIGNLTTAIQQFQREFNSARGRRSDDKRVTLEVLWNFLFAVASKSSTLKEHLNFAKVGKMLANNHYVGKVVHGGATALQRAVDRVNTANDRPLHTENWDADLLVTDTLDDTERLITDIESVISSAAGGRLNAGQLRHLPWHNVYETYATEKSYGYTPIITTPLGHSTAQATLSVVKEDGALSRLEALVWSPLVHNDGAMVANRIIEAPVQINDSTYVTFMPADERIILVARTPSRDGNPWVALTAAEFADCRPAGRYHTCPHIRTTRPPLRDEYWPHQDADVCAYALYAAKPKLAVSACSVKEMHDDVWAKSVDPFSWIVFSRQPLNPEIICDRDPSKVPRRVQLYGVGLLRIPPLCRVNMAGWALTSDRHALLDPEHGLSHTRVIGLLAAWDAAQEAVRSASPSGNSGEFFGKEHLAFRLIGEQDQYAPWILPVGLTMCILMCIATVAFGAGFRNLHLKFQSTHRVVTTINTEGTQELQHAIDNIDHRLKLVESLSTNLTKFVHGSNLLSMTTAPQLTATRAFQALKADKAPRSETRHRTYDHHEAMPLVVQQPR